MLDMRSDRNAGWRKTVLGIDPSRYGPEWELFFDSILYMRIEPIRMFTFHMAQSGRACSQLRNRTSPRVAVSCTTDAAPIDGIRASRRTGPVASGRPTRLLRDGGASG